MGLYEKMKSGELYDCSMEALPEELAQKLMECKELIYDFNHSRPREEALRQQIIRQVFAQVGGELLYRAALSRQLGLPYARGQELLRQF